MEGSSARFLTVTPDTLFVDGPYDETKYTKFGVYNGHGCNLVFKIKSTCAESISLAPNIGFIKPYERIEVLVTLAGNCFDPTIRNREKFLIQSAVTSVPCNVWAQTNAKEIIRNVAKPDEVRLTIRFLPSNLKNREEMVSPKGNPTLPLESKKQQNTESVVPQTTFFLKNDGTYERELEEKKKQHEKQKITGLLDQQGTFFVNSEGTHLPYPAINSEEEEENPSLESKKQDTGLVVPQKTFFVKGDGTFNPPVTSSPLKRKQDTGVPQNTFFLNNDDGTWSAMPSKNSKDEMKPEKSPKLSSELKKQLEQHQNTGAKPKKRGKEFHNGYQHSDDDDGDDEDESIQEEPKSSGEHKDNFDIPDKVTQLRYNQQLSTKRPAAVEATASPINDMTETTGQNEPTSSERTLSQKTTLIDENNNTKPKNEVPKKTVPSETTPTTWDWVKDMTSNIKELGDRMTALEAKTKEPPKIPQDLRSNIKEMLDRMTALETKVKEKTQDVTSNIKKLRDCMTALDAKTKEKPKIPQDITSNIKAMLDRMIALEAKVKENPTTDQVFILYGNVKELRDRVTALEATTKEPPKRADEKKDMDSDNIKRQAMNNEIQGKNAAVAVAASADISPHEIQSKNHLQLGVLTVAALVLAFGLGRETVGKAV